MMTVKLWLFVKIRRQFKKMVIPTLLHWKLKMSQLKMPENIK